MSGSEVAYHQVFIVVYGCFVCRLEDGSRSHLSTSSLPFQNFDCVLLDIVFVVRKGFMNIGQTKGRQILPLSHSMFAARDRPESRKDVTITGTEFGYIHNDRVFGYA